MEILLLLLGIFILLDIAALKGVPMLAETYEITAKDLQDAKAKLGK